MPDNTLQLMIALVRDSQKMPRDNLIEMEQVSRKLDWPTPWRERRAASKRLKRLQELDRLAEQGLAKGQEALALLMEMDEHSPLALLLATAESRAAHDRAWVAAVKRAERKDRISGPARETPRRLADVLAAPRLLAA